MENLGDALNFMGLEAHFSPDDQAILYLGLKGFPDFSGLATAYVFDAPRAGRSSAPSRRAAKLRPQRGLVAGWLPDRHRPI